MYNPTDKGISLKLYNIHLYYDHTVYSFLLYTFLWPEDGPQWPKHVVVSIINRIQDSCVVTCPTPFLIAYSTTGMLHPKKTDRAHEMKLGYWLIFQYCRPEIKTEDGIYQTERGHISLSVTRELCCFTKWKLIKLSGQQFYLTAASGSPSGSDSQSLLWQTLVTAPLPPKAYVHNTLIGNPHVSNSYFRPNALCWSWSCAVCLPTQHAYAFTYFSQKKREIHIYIFIKYDKR